MTDTPDLPAFPTQEAVERWTTAVHRIMTQWGVSEEQANLDLAALLDNIEADPAGTAVNVWNMLVDHVARRDGLTREQADKNLLALVLGDRVRWEVAVADLRATFPELTEAEANDNLANLLENFAADPEGAAVSVFSQIVTLISKRDGISDDDAATNFANLLRNVAAGRVPDVS